MAYKLTYFDATWRAEPVRLILAAAGVKFEDVRVKFEDWPELKKTLEWGQLPILQVGDQVLTQSKTMYRFLGRKFNLAGQDEWESARCDEIVDAVGDLMEEHIKIVWYEKDETKKAELQKKFSTELLPNFLERLDKRQGTNGGDWIVGKNMTWADITVMESLRLMTEADPSVLDAYPNVKKSHDAVFAVKGIKEFRDAHQK